MALTNFVLTVMAVGAGFMLLRSDVRRSAVSFRSNMKHIRHWLEQEHPSGDSAFKAGQTKAREVEAGVAEKTAMKEEKH